MAAFEPLGNGMCSAGCIHSGGGGGVTDGRLRGVDVEETERNQTFAAMFRTYHYMKLYHSVVFMVSLRKKKGSSFTGTYFLIN